jgi:hypothetical protein
MNTEPMATVFRAPLKKALAGLIVGLLLISSFASASPCLHHWLHSDSQSPTHYCLVTSLEQGQTEAVPLDVLLPVPLFSSEASPKLPTSFVSGHNPVLHPERGPPAAR